MKLFYDIITIIAFLVVFKTHGFFAATAVIIALLGFGVVASYAKNKKLDKLQAGIFVLVLLLALPTFVLQNEIFFKWKPTVVYWLFAIGLIVTRLFEQKKSFFEKKLAEQKIVLPALIIRRVLYLWITYFVLMGLANIYVAYEFSTEFWVYFKVFGSLGTMIVLMIITVIMLYPYLKHLEQTTDNDNEQNR